VERGGSGLFGFRKWRQPGGGYHYEKERLRTGLERKEGGSLRQIEAPFDRKKRGEKSCEGLRKKKQYREVLARRTCGTAELRKEKSGTSLMYRGGGGDVAQKKKERKVFNKTPWGKGRNLYN